MSVKTSTPCENCGQPVDHDDPNAVSVNDGAEWESSRIWWHGDCNRRCA